MLLETIGWLGGLSLTVCGLPQLVTSYKSKSFDGVSFWMLIIWFFGLLFSGVYVMFKTPILLPLAFNYWFNVVVVGLLIFLYIKNPTYKYKTKREAIFETNSSSTHSITIGKNKSTLSTMTPDTEGIINLSFGEFGWEIKQYTDPETKASYAITWAVNYAPQYLESILRVIQLHTGVKKINIDTIRGGYHTEGHIDHQSVDVITCVADDDESLKQFIFNPTYILNTDNDNH